jgi:CSLREA domain-containing protein
VFFPVPPEKGIEAVTRTNYLRAFAVLAAMAASLLLLLGPVLPARAQSSDATITVNTTADEATPANHGKCSLREAITNANNDDQSGSTDCSAGSGEDTINFSSGTTGRLR